MWAGFSCFTAAAASTVGFWISLWDAQTKHNTNNKNCVDVLVRMIAVLAAAAAAAAPAAT